MRVHVQDIPIPTLPPSSGDVSRSDAPDSSKSPPPEEHSKEVHNALIVTLLIVFIGISLLLFVTCAVQAWLIKKKKPCPCSQNQLQEVLPGVTRRNSFGTDSDDGERGTATDGDSSLHKTCLQSNSEDEFENKGRGVFSRPTCEDHIGTDSVGFQRTDFIVDAI
ncbi:uncharacterized protein LOC111343570 [Stylophora pistillata]|uniref:uncharacterized protein LOC111343570 n=1 Tax=Stylophora pistillata TaxID=50429 RepID=UPI000C047619|nr:uncharacterized protein LOC111343570 [Stylophora pistillata]